MNTSTDEPRRCKHGHPNSGGKRYCGTCGVPLIGDVPPVWSRLAEIPRVVSHGPHLRRTLITALIVGTVLFGINQLNVVLAGHPSGVVWLKSGLTYCVPFVVSNIGILIATYRPRAKGART